MVLVILSIPDILSLIVLEGEEEGELVRCGG